MRHAKTEARIKQRLYPELGAGGFSHVDGTIEFYSRIAALISAEFEVLDFGAGRGAFLDDPVPYRRDLQNLRGKVRRVIGADVDDGVLENAAIDEAVVLEPDSPLPFDQERFDFIVSDWTFEHLADPVRVANELDRVLKPGGWICGRTPNRWGYVGIGARLIPNAFHARLLRRLQPSRREIDVFPTTYRLNTRQVIRRHFPPSRFEDFTYVYTPDPSYSGRSALMWRAAAIAPRLLPDRLGSILYVFLRKR